MKKWKSYALGLATLAGLSGSLWAQPGILPPPPAAGTVAPSRLFSFLGLTKDQLEAMRRKCCQSTFGQLLGNSMKPVSVFTGGVMGNFCPQMPNAADLAKPGAEGAANKIKKDELEAKARRAAVRYLGTVDCHYWPDAEKELIASLRADRIECVRWEAAMALGGGCCCTKRTIEALTISATGSDKDGNPSETCERVRDAAFASLQRCLACYSQEVPAEPKKPEKPEAPNGEKPDKTAKADADADPSIQQMAYYRKLDNKPLAQVVQEARSVTAESSLPSSEVSLPTGHRGLLDIATYAISRPGATRGSKAGEATAPPAKNDSVKAPVLVPVPEKDPKKMTLTQPSSFQPPVPMAAPSEGKGPLAVMPPAPPSTPPSLGMEMPRTPPATTKHEIEFPRPPLPVIPPLPVSASIVAPPPPVSAPTVASPSPVSTPAVAPPTQASVPEDPQQLLHVLNNSYYPHQRERAIEALARLDLHDHPEAAQAILTAACNDPAPSVKVVCIRSLVKMNVDTLPLVLALQSLRGDPNARVAYEAEMALVEVGKQQPGAPSKTAATSTTTPVTATPALTPAAPPAAESHASPGPAPVPKAVDTESNEPPPFIKIPMDNLQ